MPGLIRPVNRVPYAVRIYLPADVNAQETGVRADFFYETSKHPSYPPGDL